MGCCDIQEVHEDEVGSEFRRLLKKSIVALIVGIPLFVISMLDKTYVSSGLDQTFWIIVGIIVFFVMWYSGGHFYSGAWKSFKAHNANMNTLITLATAPAWGYSMLVAIWPTLVPTLARHIYFDAPMTVIGLIVFGHALESLASEKATAPSRELAKLMPHKAQVMRDGQLQEIDVHDIKQDDKIQVEAGKNFPVDGEILEGSSEIDEVHLTAERLLVAKKIGDKVFAGTTNKTQTLQIRVTHTASESALTKMIEMIKQGENSKPAIGKIADKIAFIFAPFVIIVAFITPQIWYNFGPTPQIAYMLVTFMAVLLIACPCALGLGAPISVAAGVSKAAGIGVIFRKGDAFQATKQISTLVLDKVRKDAKHVTPILKQRGIKTILFATGNQQQAEQAAKEAGIDEVITGLSLDDKIAKVKQLKQQGAHVAVTSDGINDIALLDEANISIAMGIRAYLAESADIAIMSESLYTVLDAMAISKATIRNIKQNLAGAFFYNSAGLPVAAGVFYPVVHALLNPILAGALMATSSIAVIINANRIHLFKPTKRVA